jgi:hypothetical protein|tara:strand:+ start:117 stop:503 length:387 start_codon:yes stop_codon:yes gene_type:complete
MSTNYRLCKYKIEKIVDCFCIDIDAYKTTQLLKLNRKPINRYFNAFPTLIYQHQCSEKEQFVGVIEVDESFFGADSIIHTDGWRGYDKHFCINKIIHFASQGVHINGIETFRVLLNADWQSSIEKKVL